MTAFSPLKEALAGRFEGARSVFESFAGKRLLITGGTGFFGKWLLAAIAFANERWSLRISATSLSRNPEKLFKSFPEFSSLPGIAFASGEARGFSLDGSFDFIIHAATESAGTLEKDDPGEMRSVIVDGSKHVLDFAKRAGAKRLLFISSGGVYGEPPAEMDKIPESLPCQPFSAYGKGKLEAERLCADAKGVECSIARCFAFVGPYLPLDAHFAAGNFIRDALAGKEIVIQSDGSQIRSYMHPSDLTLWLLTLLAKGEHGKPFNVGSEEAVSIRELAEKTCRLAGGQAKLSILGRKCAGAASRYVPDIGLARRELGLSVGIGLEEALSLTLSWHKKARSAGPRA